MDEEKVEEMKRITEEYKNIFRKGKNQHWLTKANESESRYYDSINVTGENLDTILDCPEEEEYESQKKPGKMFLNSSYSHSRREENFRLISRLEEGFQFQQISVWKLLWWGEQVASKVRLISRGVHFKTLNENQLSNFSRKSLLDINAKEESKDTITTKKASINNCSKPNSKNYGTQASDFLNCTEVLKAHKHSESLKFKGGLYDTGEDSSVDVYENHSRKVHF